MAELEDRMAERLFDAKIQQEKERENNELFSLREKVSCYEYVLSRY